MAEEGTYAKSSDRHWLFRCMTNEIFDYIAVFVTELFGTGMLVFFISSTCILWEEAQSSQWGSIAAGAVILAVNQTFGAISGAHANPAVSLGAALSDAIPYILLPIYIVAQLIGGILGYGFLKLLTPTAFFISIPSGPGVCTNVLGPKVTIIQGLLVEVFGTMCYVLTWCSCWDHRHSTSKEANPLKIGAAFLLLALTIGPFSSCGMNPARSFGPALINMYWKDHWIYWLGPIIGAFLASVFYKVFCWRPSE